MGDPVTTTMIISAAASAASGISGMMAANEQASQTATQYAFQRRQSEDAARAELTAAAQEEAARRTQLNETLSTIDSIRASRGLSLSSPTGQVVSDYVDLTGTDNIQQGKLNRMTRVNALTSQADYYGQASDDALDSHAGLFSLLTGVAQAGSTLYGSGIFKSSAPGATIANPNPRLTGTKYLL